MYETQYLRPFVLCFRHCTDLAVEENIIERMGSYELVAWPETWAPIHNHVSLMHEVQPRKINLLSEHNTARNPTHSPPC